MASDFDVDDPTCCELACYEDPGCCCEGCATPDSDLVARIEAEAYERGAVAGMAMERYAPAPPSDAAAPLREALDKALAILHADATDPNRKADWRYGVRHTLTVIEGWTATPAPEEADRE